MLCVYALLSILGCGKAALTLAGQSGFASFPVPEKHLGITSLHNFNHVLISKCPKALLKTLEISIYLTLQPQANQPITRKGNFIFTFSSRRLQGIRVASNCSSSADQLFGMDISEQALLLQFSTYSILGHKVS